MSGDVTKARETFISLSCEKLILYRNGAHVFLIPQIERRYELPGGVIDDSISVVEKLSPLTSSREKIDRTELNQKNIAIHRRDTWEEKFMLGKLVTLGVKGKSATSTTPSNIPSEYHGIVLSWRRKESVQWSCSLNLIDTRAKQSIPTKVIYLEIVDYFIIHDTVIRNPISTDTILIVNVLGNEEKLEKESGEKKFNDVDFLYSDLSGTFQYRIDLKRDNTFNLISRVVIRNQSTNTIIFCVTKRVKISTGDVRFPSAGGTRQGSASRRLRGGGEEHAMALQSARGATMAEDEGEHDLTESQDRYFHRLPSKDVVSLTSEPNSETLLTNPKMLISVYQFVYIAHLPLTYEFKGSAIEKVELHGVKELIPRGLVLIYREERHESGSGDKSTSTMTMNEGRNFISIGSDMLEDYKLKDDVYYYRLTTFQTFSPIQIESKVIDAVPTKTVLEVVLYNDDEVMHAVELKFNVTNRNFPTVIEEEVEETSGDRQPITLIKRKKFYLQFKDVLVDWNLGTPPTIERSLPHILMKFHLPKRTSEQRRINAKMEFVFEKIPIDTSVTTSE